MLIFRHDFSLSCMPAYLFLLILLFSNPSPIGASSVSLEATEDHLQTSHQPETNNNRNNCRDGNPCGRKRAATDVEIAHHYTFKTTITDWISLQTTTTSSLTAMQNFYNGAIRLISALSPTSFHNSTITLIFGSLVLTLTLVPTDPTAHALSMRQFIPDPTAVIVDIIHERLKQVRRGLVGLFRMMVKLVGLSYFIGMMQGILPLERDEQMRHRLGWGLVNGR
ncbi:MAG: hypothetical protein Q9228_006850 [Teloschistes exilis]